MPNVHDLIKQYEQVEERIDEMAEKRLQRMITEKKRLAQEQEDEMLWGWVSGKRG